MSTENEVEVEMVAFCLGQLRPWFAAAVDDAFLLGRLSECIRYPGWRSHSLGLVMTLPWAIGCNPFGVMFENLCLSTYIYQPRAYTPDYVLAPLRGCCLSFYTTASGTSRSARWRSWITRL